MKLHSVLLRLALPLLLVACGGGGATPVARQTADIDETPPTSAVTPGGGEFPTLVELEFTSSEPATIFVSVDGKPYVRLGESPAHLTLEEGRSTVKFYAVDRADNVETAAHTEAFLIDVSAPRLAFAEGTEIEPLPWLGEAVVAWESDEACDWVVRTPGSEIALAEGRLDEPGGETFRIDAKDLPEGGREFEVAATDWTGRTSVLPFRLERAAAVVVDLDADPGDVVVSPAGDRAFVARKFQSVVDVVDLESGAVVESIDVGIRAWSMTMHPGGTRLYVSNAVAPGAIAVIDVETSEVETLDVTTGIPGPVAFSADGAFGFFTDFDGAIRVIGTDPDSLDYHANVDRIPVADGLLHGEIVVDPDGEHLVVNWAGVGEVGLAVVEFGESDPTVRNAWTSSVATLSGLSQAITQSSDGARVFLSSTKLLCGLCRFDIDEDELVHVEKEPDEEGGSSNPFGKVPDVPWGLALFDDGATLLSVGPNGPFLRCYDADSMELLVRFPIGAGAQALATTGSSAVVARSSGSKKELLVIPLR